jgi:hypothetical protein
MRVGVRHSIPLPGPFYLSTGHRRYRRRRRQPSMVAALLWLLLGVSIVITMIAR